MEIEKIILKDRDAWSYGLTIFVGAEKGYAQPKNIWINGITGEIIESYWRGLIKKYLKL